MTSSPILAVDNLTVGYGDRTILDDLDLTVNSGQSVAIQGRSGSGKSTLLSAILGIVAPTAGSIRVSGQEVIGLKRRKLAVFRSNTIGMVFQHAELIESLTAIENVALPALLINTPVVTAQDRAADLLDSVQVPNEPTLAADLSGGERQRVALARALINDPALIIADEPTGALDAELRDLTADMLFQIPKKQKCGLVVVTHDPAIAVNADHHYHLYNGKLTR